MAPCELEGARKAMCTRMGVGPSAYALCCRGCDPGRCGAHRLKAEAEEDSEIVAKLRCAIKTGQRDGCSRASRDLLLRAEVRELDRTKLSLEQESASLIWRHSARFQPQLDAHTADLADAHAEFERQSALLARLAVEKTVLIERVQLFGKEKTELEAKRTQLIALLAKVAHLGPSHNACSAHCARCSRPLPLLSPAAIQISIAPCCSIASLMGHGIRRPAHMIVSIPFHRCALYRTR